MNPMLLLRRQTSSASHAADPHRHLPAGLLLAAVLGGLLAFLPAQAQRFVPDAPIKDFRMPMFGDNGYRTWVLEGMEGHYHSPEKVSVIGMDLRTYSGDQRNLLENSILSPEAVFFIQQSKAHGTVVRVRGPQFEVNGKDWTWDGQAKKVEIQREVRVRFEQPLNDILR